MFREFTEAAMKTGLSVSMCGFQQVLNVARDPHAKNEDGSHAATEAMNEIGDAAREQCSDSLGKSVDNLNDLQEQMVDTMFRFANVNARSGKSGCGEGDQGDAWKSMMDPFCWIPGGRSGTQEGETGKSGCGESEHGDMWRWMMDPFCWTQGGRSRTNDCATGKSKGNSCMPMGFPNFWCSDESDESESDDGDTLGPAS